MHFFVGYVRGISTKENWTGASMHMHNFIQKTPNRVTLSFLVALQTVVSVFSCTALAKE